MSQRKPFKAKLSTHTAKLIAEGGPVTIAAGAVDGERKGPPTFEGVGYSGAVVSRATLNASLPHDYIIDLAGMGEGRNVKANLDHKKTQRVGHLTAVENDKKQLKVSGLLSAATPHRDEVANSAGNGYGWEVSIEADLGKPTKLDAGKTAIVNGRPVSGPLYIFRKSTLTGLGFVSNGADAGNTVTVAATAAKDEPMNEFEKFAASLGVDLESASDEQKANCQKLFKAQQGGVPPADAFAASVSDIANEARARRQHASKIAEICKAAMEDHPALTDQIETLAKAALESQTDPDKFELELIRATRSRKGQFSAQMSGTREDPRVIEAAICVAAGLPDVEKKFSEKVLDAVDRSGLAKGFSIQSMLMQAAHANGYSCRPGERVHAGNLRAILEHALPPSGYRAQLNFSTASLPNILGAVANKMILSGYMEEDPTWREIAEIKPVSNFYTQNHYRMLDSLEYEEVGSGGEIKHGTLGEETYTSRAKTYGKMLGLTRTQIINDDLGAFNDLRTRLGRGAAKKFNTVFWTAFIDNSAFYTTALTNYIEGSTTNLGTDGVGLGLMVKAFRTMTSPSADGLKRVGQDINPTKILVPPELEANAMLAFRSNNLDNVALSSGNIYANRFRPVVQWRLSNSSFTGYSTTAFYMFGDTVKPMLVTFLNGQQAPTVESTDADFDTLGVLFRGYHDFGCDKSEYLAGIKSKGAA
jgi:hypothetical protein